MIEWGVQDGIQQVKENQFDFGLKERN